MILELTALGTKWWINTSEKLPKNISKEINKIVLEFEQNYTRFNNSSYIGILNDKKILINPTDELLSILTFALDVYSQTNGVFNISIGSELEKSGYGIKHDISSKVSKDLIKDISITKESIKLSKSTRIDLGGLGKGWLIEKLAGYLKHSGINNFIINGGGDITTSGNAVDIYLEHPLNSKLQIGKVELHNNSLASSSNIKRSWINKGKRRSHIIHPEDNKLDDLLSVHVMADSILFADTFATIFMLVNRKKRLEYCERYGFEYMEILEDMTVFKTPGFNINLN